MKKKGLIISTIVMVVVLIAALTTSTYAWFNAAAAATVDNVTVSVASASNISIGVATTKNASRSDATSYVNGTISYAETNTQADKGKGLGTFSSTDSLTGLGLSVKWDWVLSSKGGVSSSQNGTAFDATYNAANALYNGSLNAAGTAVVFGDLTKYNGNVAEGDNANTVIYAPFGLRVEKDDLNYLYCDITVTASSAQFWGIVAALKLEITSTSSNYSGHPFAADTGDGLLGTAITYQSVPGENTTVVFRFIIAKNTAAALAHGSASTIYQFDIRMFIDGADPSCHANATPYGATIGLAFNAVDSTGYAGLDSANVKDLTVVTP